MPEISYNTNMTQNQARALQGAVSTIVRIQKIMEPSLKTAHGTLKLAPPDIQTLRFISEHPGTMSNAVAKFLGVVPTTMTSIVDRLVKRGFVSRKRPEDNRRAVALHLTDLGAEVFAQLAAEELESSARMLSFLDEDQRAAFVASATVIAEGLERLKDQAAG